MGTLKVIEAAPQVTGTIFSPDAKKYVLYQEALEKQRELYKHVTKKNSI